MGWVVLGLLVVLVLWLLVSYNGLVSMNQRANQAFADIDVQLKQRHDLIPNLVETVKAYAAHEKSALEAVINARAKAMSAQGPEAKTVAENQLSQSLKSLFALAEAYPQLRAVEAFNQLQGSLSQVEDALQNARRYYNAVVRDYNAKTQEVPTNFIAGWFNFTGRQFFELTETTQREPPRVQF